MRLLVNSGLALIAAVAFAACGHSGETPLKELQRVHAGALDVVLLSAEETLRQGQGGFAIEFKGADGQLVDVGTVTVNATMIMAGMGPMLGQCNVQATQTKGRYSVTSNLGMAGSWRFSASWDGPAGRGSVTIPATVL